jgi:hypothetical protein
MGPAGLFCFMAQMIQEMGVMPKGKKQNAMTHYSHKLSLPAFDLLCALRRNGGRHEQVDMCSRARAQGETLVGLLR